MLFSSRTCIKDLGTLQQDTSVDSYSAATYKCIPICSNTVATSFITIDEKGFTFKDVSANTIVIDTAGIKVTDMSANDITMNADGISLTDAAGNSLKTTSSKVSIAAANGCKIEMGSSGTVINGKLTVIT